MAQQRALLLVGGNITGVSTASTTWYAPFFGTTPGLPANTTEAAAQVVMRGGGTLRFLSVRVLVNSRTTASTLTLRKNGANAAVSITIPANTTGVFTDYINTVSLADGDLFCYALTTGTGSGAMDVGSVSVALESGGQCFTYLGWLGGPLSTAATSAFYLGLAGTGGSTATGAADFQLKALESATISHLQVYISANTKTGSSTVQFVKNGTTQTQTVTIGAGATGLFEDTSHSDALALGDTFEVLVTPHNDAGSLTIVFVAVKYTGNVSGQAPVYAYSSPSITTTSFLPPGGTFLSASENNAQASVPAATWSAMQVYMPLNSATATTTINTRKNGVNGAQTVSFSAAATGYQQDTTHTDTTAAGDLFCLECSGMTSGTARPFAVGFLVSLSGQIVTGATALGTTSGLVESAVGEASNAATSLGATSGLSSVGSEAEHAAISMGTTAGVAPSGAGSEHGTVAMGSTSGLVATGSRARLGAISLGAASGLSTTIARTVGAAIALGAMASLIPTASRARKAQTAMGASAGLSASAARSRLSSIALGATASITNTATRIRRAVISMTVAAAIAVSPAVPRIIRQFITSLIPRS